MAPAKRAQGGKLDQAGGRPVFNRLRAVSGELDCGSESSAERRERGAPIIQSSWFSFTQSLVVETVVPSTVLIASSTEGDKRTLKRFEWINFEVRGADR